MKFSAQEEYGLRCLIQIARKGDQESMTIPEISKLEGLTTTHAAKLLMILRKEGYITSVRGQSGGYSLSRSPQEIKISDVLHSLGGRLYDAEFCGKHSGALDICTHAVDCSVRSLWQVIQQAVDSVIEHLTLSDMLEDEKSNITFFDERPRHILTK